MKHVFVILALFLLALPAMAQDKEPIIIGDLMAYTTFPEGAYPYKNGYQLALKEINENGGILGRPVEVIFRDSKGDPGEALRVAEELISVQKVDYLTGTVYDNVGLAIHDFSQHNEIIFFRPRGGPDQMIFEDFHPYGFRLGSSTSAYMTILAEEAAKIPAKKWGFLAPNYEFGRSTVRIFKEELKKRKPEVEFVYEQFSPTLKLNAGVTVQAMQAKEPDAIFNALFGSDLAKFLREGRSRGFFENIEVVSALAGEPENLESLGKEAPVGWLSLGYPYEQIEEPEHNVFVRKYRETYSEPPRSAALEGYTALYILKTAIEKAGSIETDKLIEALEGVSYESVIGPVTIRPDLHQSDWGVWVGRTGFIDERPTLVDWKYVSGADYYPDPDIVQQVKEE